MTKDVENDNNNNSCSRNSNKDNDTNLDAHDYGPEDNHDRGNTDDELQ